MITINLSAEQAKLVAGVLNQTAADTPELGDSISPVVTQLWAEIRRDDQLPVAVRADHWWAA